MSDVYSYCFQIKFYFRLQCTLNYDTATVLQLLNSNLSDMQVRVSKSRASIYSSCYGVHGQ